MVDTSSYDATPPNPAASPYYNGSSSDGSSFNGQAAALSANYVGSGSGANSAYYNGSTNDGSSFNAPDASSGGSSSNSGNNGQPAQPASPAQSMSGSGGGGRGGAPASAGAASGDKSPALPTIVDQSGQQYQSIVYDQTKTHDAQVQLSALGLYNGKTDGYYGPQTRGAVTQFQTNWNATHPSDQITVDGWLADAPPGLIQTMPRLQQAFAGLPRFQQSPVTSPLDVLRSQGYPSPNDHLPAQTSGLGAAKAAQTGAPVPAGPAPAQGAAPGVAVPGLWDSMTPAEQADAEKRYGGGVSLANPQPAPPAAASPIDPAQIGAAPSAAGAAAPSADPYAATFEKIIAPYTPQGAGAKTGGVAPAVPPPAGVMPPAVPAPAAGAPPPAAPAAPAAPADAIPAASFTNAGPGMGSDQLQFTPHAAAPAPAIAGAPASQPPANPPPSPAPAPSAAPDTKAAALSAQASPPAAAPPTPAAPTRAPAPAPAPPPAAAPPPDKTAALSAQTTQAAAPPAYAPAPPVAPAATPAVAAANAEANPAIPPTVSAFVNALAIPGVEGAGYDTRVPRKPDGTPDYSRFPPNPTAAVGKAQWLPQTWNEVVAAHPDVTDFSPPNQDKAAAYLAQDRYKQVTGRDMATDLAAGKVQQVAQALHGTWPSLIGGSQQGSAAKSGFFQAYQANLSRQGQTAGAGGGGAPAAPGSASTPVTAQMGWPGAGQPPAATGGPDFSEASGSPTFLETGMSTPVVKAAGEQAGLKNWQTQFPDATPAGLQAYQDAQRAAAAQGPATPQRSQDRSSLADLKSAAALPAPNAAVAPDSSLQAAKPGANPANPAAAAPVSPAIDILGLPSAKDQSRVPGAEAGPSYGADQPYTFVPEQMPPTRPARTSDAGGGEQVASAADIPSMQQGPPGLPGTPGLTPLTPGGVGEMLKAPATPAQDWGQTPPAEAPPPTPATPIGNRVPAQVASADNPAAAGALTAYQQAFPDVVQRFQDQVGQITDPRAQHEVAVKATILSEAAQATLAVPPGPERVQTFNFHLDQMASLGVIDQQTHDKWYGNPSDLVLGHAVALGDTVQQMMA